MGLVAPVHRFWVSGGVTSCLESMSWPDPVLVQVYKLQRYNALVSLGGWWELPPTPAPQKHKMGSGCLQSWVWEEVSGSLEEKCKG